MKIDWEKRLRSKETWVTMFALIALTGKLWGWYNVPEGWDLWVDLLLMFLTALGIINNPTTKGLGD